MAAARRADRLAALKAELAEKIAIETEIADAADARQWSNSPREPESNWSHRHSGL